MAEMPLHPQIQGFNPITFLTTEERMKEIAAAFVKAQKAFGPALKNNQNPHFRSKYADLGSCIEAVIDALNQNGFALVQKMHEDPSGVTVYIVEQINKLESRK